MHPTPNSFVAPRSGICVNFIRPRCIMSLLKMLTYSTYVALLRLSRHSLFPRATADRLTLVELHNFDNRCEIPLLASGASGRDLLFLRQVLVIFAQRREQSLSLNPPNFCHPRAPLQAKLLFQFLSFLNDSHRTNTICKI